MKKAVLLFTMTLLPLLASAQQFRFGYFSMQQVLEQVPAYTVALRDNRRLAAQYKAELSRSEQEFNAKYEDFLSVQASLAPSIRDKRQAELKDLMTRNIAFKQQSDSLVSQALRNAVSPLRAKIMETVRRIGRQEGFAFVANTDNAALPYVNEENGVDISRQIINGL